MVIKKVVIDTNIYSNLLKGDVEIQKILSMAEIIYFPVFVLAELLFGFKGGKNKKNNEILEIFLNKLTVTLIQTTTETADIFAQIKNDLKKKGKPIPTHDLWIASQTLETGAVLMTYDKHFSHIPGLRIWIGE